ncbi:helix-turn-helix domain-containing protein [Gloeocapsa sp. PCC 73106]|uniref:helix-turn-helix domain-containing protein n=1 Tax=Gloeocapsa sp. PCC 73106 TaxID=102232 RepID=UPI0002ABED93|nr:helix-turn-helix transcriptional regulator [Gloeocapsa sp. PCC 73106]ELR96853.1 putative conserved small protein [Gloeocapsa sp. PCC 73106]
MTISQSVGVVFGHENVFEDLGFFGEEAVNLKIRADLMLELRSFIQTKGWTQKDAAVFFDETQTRISNLMNGDINLFTVDKLLIMLTKAGMLP